VRTLAQLAGAGLGGNWSKEKKAVWVRGEEGLGIVSVRVEWHDQVREASSMHFLSMA